MEPRSHSTIRSQYQLRVSPELQTYFLKSLRDLFLLMGELFVENTMGQVISSVEHNRIPLRDLGFELLTTLNVGKFAFYGYKLTVEMIALLWIVVCFIHGSRGLILIQKGARCLTIARILRMCLYTMTVLPSPKPWCRFDEPINPFKLRVGGACNDLLYSGHVIVYTLAGISLTSLARQYSSIFIRIGVPFGIWLHIIQRILCTILERHHYSIDMFLGVIITFLMWQCPQLHIDLPRVPNNLSGHLRQFFFPKYRTILLKNV